MEQGTMSRVSLDKEEIRSLVSENQSLRDLVVSLSATLLLNVSRDSNAAAVGEAAPMQTKSGRSKG